MSKSTSNKSKRSSGPISRKKTSSPTDTQTSQDQKSDGSLPLAKQVRKKAWATRRRLMRYIAGLKHANHFMSEGKIRFLKGLRPSERKNIYKHLKEVDPEGLKELRLFSRRLNLAKKHEKQLPMKEAVEEMGLAVAEAEYESKGITKLRIVNSEGLLNIVAILKASGYSPEEICEKLDLAPEIVNRVSSTEVAKMKYRLPELIVEAADRKVLRDLLDGDITETTTKADMIAQRRRRIVLDAIAVGQKDPSPPKLERDAEDHGTFFGVTKAIEAEFKEVPKDEEESS